LKIFVGTDIVENQRIEKAIDKFKDRFLKRIYTERELSYCFSQKNSIGCLSARFAAKEACIKAYYQAFKKVLHFSQIEVLGKQGLPAEILLHLKEPPEKPYNLIISLAHEQKFSVATVIIYL
jgi:holo-[acyl-carrier protein] synthase